MRLAISGEHRYFFQKHGYIYFQGLLTTEQSREYFSCLKTYLFRKGLLPIGGFEKALADNSSSFSNVNLDIWRDEPVLKDLALKRSNAKIISELGDGKDLQIAFDQILSLSDLKKMFRVKGGISSTTSFQVIEGAILYFIKKSEIPFSEKTTVEVVETQEGEEGETFFKEETTEALDLLEGDAIYLDSNRSFKTKLPHGIYYLVAYAEYGARYAPNKADPHQNYLKSLGYGHGDKLKSSVHPAVYRKA